MVFLTHPAGLSGAQSRPRQAMLASAFIMSLYGKSHPSNEQTRRYVVAPTLSANQVRKARNHCGC